MFNDINFLTEPPSVMITKFIDDYTSVFPDIDKAKAYQYIKTNEKFVSLTQDWYRHLENEDLNAAYSVYGDKYYFTDMWNCFKVYSRLYLRTFTKTNKDSNISIASLIGKPKVIVDLGCGIGYCTTMLKQMYPESKVYATNLRNTDQWTFCEKMAQKYDFTMVEDISNVPDKVDLIFASEYFEHILNPVEHVLDIISKNEPKYFVIANAFNTWSIGHFETYKHDGKDIDQSRISKMFNATLKNNGYKKIKTGIFNDRPTFWEKQ
jgi:2-polyprenyl-3-methyl-5-hydroxy-6-metoxy-1,4-benzoquinol methylase